MIKMVRTGTALIFTWLLILVVIYNLLIGSESLQIILLEQLLIFSFVSVLLFALIFTEKVIKKLGFSTRLTMFLVSIMIWEVVFFRFTSWFIVRDNMLQWSVFLGIFILLYAGCMLIYHRYSLKKGIVYTELLQKYQEGRKE